MPIHVNASFGKKIPIPGTDFSSQQFHAAVELELSEGLQPEELRSRIGDAFSTVKLAVEDQVASALSDEDAGSNRVEPGPGMPVDAGGNIRKASNRQIKYITDLAGQHGIELCDLNARIRRDYGVEGLYDLTKRQASALLDRLKAQKEKPATKKAA